MPFSTYVEIWGKQRAFLTQNIATKFVRISFAWKNVPKSKSFIAGTSYDTWAIRTHWEIKNSVWMSSQSCNFFHCWVLPNVNLVEWVTMCRHNFVCCFGKYKVADLRTGINVIDWLESMRVPKSYAFISGTTTCCKQSCLIWIPSYSFHCSLVFTELCKWLVRWKVPYHQLIVITPTGKLCSIEWPFESANFSFMTFVLVCDWVSNSEISAQNHSISWASANSRSIPWNCTYSINVTSDSSHFFERCGIPYLCISRFSSNS